MTTWLHTQTNMLWYVQKFTCHVIHTHICCILNCMSQHRHHHRLNHGLYMFEPRWRFRRGNERTHSAIINTTGLSGRGITYRKLHKRLIWTSRYCRAICLSSPVCLGKGRDKCVLESVWLVATEGSIDTNMVPRDISHKSVQITSCVFSFLFPKATHCLDTSVWFMTWHRNSWHACTRVSTV